MVKMMRICNILILAAASFIVSCKGTLFSEVSQTKYYEHIVNETGYIENNPGNLDWYYHIPAKMEIGRKRPLVVALHACSQIVREFVAHSGWSTLAERYKFYIIYPEQKGENNQDQCFNIKGSYTGDLNNLDPADVLRKDVPYEYSDHGISINNGGESASIVHMVEKIKQKYAIGPVYVTGIERGGYMAAVLLAVYPDIFRAGVIMGGGPYLCNAARTNPVVLDIANYQKCVQGLLAKSAEEWGDLVLSYTNYSKPADLSWPRLQIWHGRLDYTISIENMDYLVKQWTYVHGIDALPGEVGKLNGYEYKKYLKNGESVVETVTIDNLGKTMAVDPGTGEFQGGEVGTYTGDHDIWSAYYAARFLGLTE